MVKNTANKRLTSAELQFCDEYLANGGNGTQAAQTIGFYGNAGKTRACRLLQKEKVREYIHENGEVTIPEYNEPQKLVPYMSQTSRDRLQAISSKELAKVSKMKMGATYEWKSRKLLRMVEFCFPDNPEAHHDVKGAVAAIAELNKMQGHYAAEKMISATFSASSDADVKEAKEIFSKILAKNETEY